MIPLGYVFQRLLLPLAAYCCLIAGQVHAAAHSQACPESFPTQPPASRLELQREADRLDQYAEACNERADYFAYYGAILLVQRRPQQAATALEKALLLNPELAGAQLDYAQALAQLGELESARELAKDVSHRPDIPLALQTWLSDRLRDLERDGWHAEWSAQWLAGHETNLGSAPTLQTLTLTLPGGDVPVALAPSERPVAGSTQRLDLTGFVSGSVGDGLLLFNGEFSNRTSPGHGDFDQRVLGANAAYLHAIGGFQAGIRMSGVRLTIGTQSAYASNGGGLMLMLPEGLTSAGCRIGLSHDYDKRKFPVSQVLNGTFTGNQAWINCRSGDWQMNAGLQAGTDHADDPNRLGGDQHRYDYTLGASHPLGAGVLSFAAQGGRISDRENYSALLGNRPRTIDRLGERIGYEYPLLKQFSVVGYFERTSQASNISLFEIKNDALYIGVKYRGGL